MSPTILTRKDKRSGTTTQSLYFRTLAMPCLNDYYDLFYLFFFFDVIYSKLLFGPLSLLPCKLSGEGRERGPKKKIRKS